MKVRVLGFNPHLHILISDGCFHQNGMFCVSPPIDIKPLEQIFRHKVLKTLLAKGKITRDMITLFDKLQHTGFNVFSGPRILAPYIIRDPFSQERMTYLREQEQWWITMEITVRFPAAGAKTTQWIIDTLHLAARANL